MEVRTESFLGTDKVIVGNKYTDLVLETLGKVYIKTGNSSKVLSDVLELLDKSSDSDIEKHIIFVGSTLEMEEMEYPGDGFFVYNTLNTTLYLSYDNRYVALIEAAEGADGGYVRRKGDTMTGQLEINTIAAPLIVASSKLVRNLNAEYLGGYSYEELAKKKIDEVITGNWTFKGKGTSENNWIFKQNVRMYGDLVTSNSITSPEFASGFGGYGWRMDADTNTLTVDYLVVRKAMRVYEMVINKISATNGSIWVSNSSKCESAFQPYILTQSALNSIGVWTGSQENKDAMLKLITSNTYYLPQVQSNIEGEVTLTKELSKPSTINTTPKTFVNYKFIIKVKDAQKVVDSPLFKGPSTLYDESLLSLTYDQYTGSATEEQFSEFKGAITLYYISRAKTVTKWSEDNDPLAYEYIDSINKDISFVMIPKNADAMDDYEANGLKSKSLVEIKTFYKYFALDKTLMDSAIGAANEAINSGLKPTVVVPNLWVINTDSEEYPTLKAGDILRCQKFTQGNIKYYDALVTNQIDTRSFVVMKATSVFDIYTELKYDDEGNLISSKEEYNNTQYNKTEQGYSSNTGQSFKKTDSTEEDRLDDITAKDDLIQMGNIQDVARQNALYLTSCDDQGPYMDVISGLDRPDYSVLYDIPIYDKVKAFIKKKGTIYSKGEAADYYHQIVNPGYINSHEKPSNITKNTKEYPLVFVKVTKATNKDEEDKYEVLVNDGEVTEISSTILGNPSKYGFFITDRPTINSEVSKNEETGKYRHAYTKSTRVRVGNLEGINNEVFGNKQPYGFGLYGENVFLTGEFYLSTGESVVQFNKDYADFLFGDLDGKYSQLTIDINGIRATVQDNENNIASLKLQANKFELAIKELGHYDEDGNYIPETSSGFVTESKLNMMFSQVIDENGKVNAASICTAINEDYSTEVRINADKIKFDGFAEFTNAVGNVVGKTTIDGGQIKTGTISSDRIDTKNLTVTRVANIGAFTVKGLAITWNEWSGKDNFIDTFGDITLGLTGVFPNSNSPSGLVSFIRLVSSGELSIPLVIFASGNSAALYCSTKTENASTRPVGKFYNVAGYFNGPLYCTDDFDFQGSITTKCPSNYVGGEWQHTKGAKEDSQGLGTNYITSKSNSKPIPGKLYSGITFAGEDIDLDHCRLTVVNGLIVGLYKED